MNTCWGTSLLVVAGILLRVNSTWAQVVNFDVPGGAGAANYSGQGAYASYKVANTVTSHEAYGLGVYGVFSSSTTKCFNTIKTPANSQQVNVHDMINVYITGETGSEMTHIINGAGSTLTTGVITATANYLWLNPAFNLGAGVLGSNKAVAFPTESWHSYQLQYKNAVTDPTWSNLGGLVGGNDAVQTITDPASANTRFYRVQSQ
jgi:hypothetical protein